MLEFVARQGHNVLLGGMALLTISLIVEMI